MLAKDHHSHPRFRALLRNMKLKETAQ